MYKIEMANFTTSNTSAPKACHTWIKGELAGVNVTLDLLNEQLVRRNYGGIAILVCFSVFGLLGNVHVLYIYSRQYKKSNYRIFVLFLAILDVINCTIVAPLVIVYLFFPLTFPSDVFCKVFRTILYFVSISSTLSLVAIAIDRFRKICHPFRDQFGTGQVKLLCVGSLVVGALLTWPAPILWGLSTVQSGIPGVTGQRCFTSDNFKSYKINFQGLYNATLILFYFIVSGTLVVIYIHIGKNIRINNKFRDTQRRNTLKSEEEVAKAAGNSARKSTITLCAVTITYVLSALPHHLLATLIFLVPNFDCNLSLLGSQLYYTFIWSYFVNSVVNPLIYGIRDRKFRFAVKRIYRRFGSGTETLSTSG
ncbi:trace amine-associated receptor 4-like isoform X2 [Mytilus galloprovincialis]|uniref:trace amine-associated receptor 4-like isoform X2 n=1 Tax=Mytilus galloprovincialis TaxID=29158 RepID=UPI003F7CBB32